MVLREKLARCLQIRGVVIHFSHKKRTLVNTWLSDVVQIAEEKFPTFSIRPGRDCFLVGWHRAVLLLITTAEAFMGLGAVRYLLLSRKDALRFFGSGGVFPFFCRGRVIQQ